MKSRPLYIALLVALAGIGVTLGYLQRSSRITPAQPSVPTPPRTSPDVPPDAATPAPVVVSAKGSASPLLDDIERLCDLLERRAASPADLAALKAALLAADPREAIAAIRRFLRSGRNASTGQDFTIGAGGTLSGAPTLRLVLLDTLGQIARKSRTDDASVVAREILAEKDSADEWAIALRNIGWTEPQARTFLADRIREMLRYEPWRTKPTPGMLEALDVVVFTKDATLIPDLDEAHAAGNELTHAADIALDRLADAAPLDVLTFLNTHPAQLNDRPYLRADYFAKADLAQPAQRAQIEIYLGRPDISLAEKTKLLRALTSPASFVSDSLLTTPPPPDDGSARRAALAQTAGDWLAHDRFPLLRTPLLEIQQRVAR